MCDAYCRAVQGRASIPGLQLVNAREDTAVIADITRQGLDIDQGMVLKLLRSGRNLLLKTMRRTRINNLQLPGRERF